MARRSDHSPQDLKELAIAKGLEIIEKDGLRGFSARKAAREIGYTVGTLYHIFGSLDLYMLHINARILDDWHADLSAQMAAAKSPGLPLLVRAYLDFARRQHARWTVLFEYSLADDTAIPKWYPPHLERLFHLLEEAMPRTTAGKAARRRQAKTLWASIHGICSLALSDKLSFVGAEKAEILAQDLLRWLEAYQGHEK